MKKEKNSKLPNWAIALIILAFVLCLLPIVIFILIFTYAYNDFNQIDNDLLVDQQINAVHNDKQNTYTLTGKISNVSDFEYYDIKVEYTFFDDSGNVIGVASDYLEELDEGKTWKFNIEYTGAGSGDIISYQLTDLEGY